MMKEIFQRITEIFDQVPAVSDLDGLRCPLVDTFDKFFAAITRNNLNGRMVTQPCSNRRRFTVRQEVNRLVSL